ncbi:hypothetical protein Q3G72_008160 [Acer saccharum]|nr:hypothetical protein Q3G72_008160 [Acer saccharum]
MKDFEDEGRLNHYSFKLPAFKSFGHYRSTKDLNMFLFNALLSSDCFGYSFIRSICAIECIDHMFHVEMNVCIICIHMITLGSPCKRHEVLVRVGMTWIAKQEDLPRVGMTRIGKQEVMARVGRTRIVMHGRLSRGKSALDRGLANILVGLGVWLDIDSDRAGYTGCVCTLEEFPIYHRCWLSVLSNIWWFRIIEGFHTFQ